MSLPSQQSADAEPISMSYAKTFLRVDHDHEDDLISDLITMARIRVEQMTRHVLITRTDTQTLPGDCPNTVKLSVAPLIRIESVRITDQDGSAHDLSAQDFSVTRRGDYTSISLIGQGAWSNYVKNIDAVLISYTAGFGSAASDVPHPLRQAILLLLAQSYELRGAIGDAPVPMMVDAVLMPYRKFWL